MSETIITNNCYGIQYYSDNNVDYNTPFIGLFMYAPCYIKFLENYQHFINIDMVENKLSRYGIHFTYPIGNIAGCEIHFHHEKNFNDAKAKWDRRKARMAEFKKCILKLCDRDLFNSDILQRFVDLDHPKKILFISNKWNYSEKSNNTIIVKTRYNNECPTGTQLYHDYPLCKYINLSKISTQSNKKISTIVEKPKKTITIQPRGGLCNHLRVVFTHYIYARSIDAELIVIWKPCGKLPGFFLDYFEPVPHITFKKNKENNDNIYYWGGVGIRKYLNSVNLYDKLKLKPAFQKIIDEKVNKLNNNYVAVHIRRTDCERLAKNFNSFTDDDQFIDFLNKFSNNTNIYIATDNSKSFNKFQKLHPQQVKFKYRNVPERNDGRGPTLDDSTLR